MPMCAGPVGPCVPHVPMCSVVSQYFLPRCAVIGIDSIFGVFPRRQSLSGELARGWKLAGKSVLFDNLSISTICQ